MIHFGISSGLRGYFAIIYDEAGPIQSGIGSYDNPQDAWSEAYDWAACEGASPIELHRILNEMYPRTKENDFDF